MNSYLLKLKSIIAEKKVFKEKDCFFDYRLYKRNNTYTIFSKRMYGAKIVAAYDKTLVTLKNNNLIIYPNISDRHFFVKIRFSEKAFPGLILNSSIESCLLLPYMRVVEDNKYKKSLRLVVITNSGQIYHNYPARSQHCDGYSRLGDISSFEESAVWDLPTGRYPSPNPKCDVFERYYPGLPPSCYDYHPVSKDDSTFVDRFGNGGFGKSFAFFENGKHVVLPRFYIHSRLPQANSFRFIGGGIKDSKMNLIGTYCSNTNCGVRICVFASSDGGRNWFNKFEFADNGDYVFKQGNGDNWGLNYGNAIKNLDYHKSYLENTLLFSRRTLVFSKKHMYDWSKPIPIKRISNSEFLTFSCQIEHGLTTGNIIALSSTQNISEQLRWLINNSYNEKSLGNNLLFKVIVIDPFSFEIRECVSQSTTNVCCRHIHHINRIKDGWIIGTGEIYPNGWIMYLQMKEADTFSIKSAYNYFEIYKLNDGYNSVQRTMGFLFNAKSEMEVIFASDHDTLAINSKNYIRNTFDPSFSRNSTGVFKGKLEDINHRERFDCIYEAKEPCFYFQDINGRLVFCGQRGEFATSLDHGANWVQDWLPSCFFTYYGNALDYHVFGDYVIKFN